MRASSPKPNKITPFTNSNYEKACLSQMSFEGNEAERILQWLQKPEDILFIYSAPGLGKTHLCAAIVNYYIAQEKPCYYIKEKALFEKLRGVISDGLNEEEYLKYLCENVFFILDDICSTRNNSDHSGMTDWQKDILFTFLDYRVNSRFPTIITSNYSLDQLGKMFHERFISRLGAARNTIIELRGLDKRKEES